MINVKIEIATVRWKREELLEFELLMMGTFEE